VTVGISNPNIGPLYCTQQTDIVVVEALLIL
jgi:hypothetical protein